MWLTIKNRLRFNRLTVGQFLNLLTAGIVVPMSAILAANIWITYERDEQVATRAAFDLAKMASQNIQEFLGESKNVVATLARRPGMRTAACDPVFQDVKDFYPRLSNFSRSTPQGLLDCSSLPQPGNRPTFVGEMAWFKQVYEQRRFVVGPIVFGPINRGWISVLAFPIFDEGGRMVGAVQSPIDLIKLPLLPAGTILPRATLITVIDTDGRIVARSKDADKFIGKSISFHKSVAEIIRRREGTTRAISLDGVERFYGFVSIPNTEWIVTVGSATDSALAGARTSALSNAVLGLVLLFVIAGLARFTASRISRPILAIRDAAKKVAAGDLHARTPVRGPLEITEVAEQFNGMLDAIESSQSALRESERRLVLATVGARLAIWELDLVSGMVYLSETWSELIGGPRAATSCTLKELARLLSEEDLKSARTDLVKCVKGQSATFYAEHRVRDAGDRQIWFASSGQVTLRNPQGLALRMSGVCRDIDERKKAELDAHRLAFYDALTGLPNRRLLRDRLEQVALAAQREGGHAALFFIDVDRFKTVNDTYGHEQGDLLLCQISEKLAACARRGDTVARLGGDEFVLLLAHLPEDYLSAAEIAEVFASKVSAALNCEYPLGDIRYRGTVSVGVTVFDAASTDDIELPLRQADMAMFQAKAEGTNLTCFFDPAMTARLQQKSALTVDLRAAVQQEQFVLHYQPQVNDLEHVTGVEALVRWEHPGRGLVPPNEFIPLADEIGLILPIGKWVLETACQQIASWALDSRREELTMAVNVSAIQLYQKNFVEVVRGALEKTGADPRRLKLELTEGVLLKNFEETIVKMESLKADGVDFSLDDFGTGYSSLSYLKRLPLSQLKIDQSFVRDVLDDVNDAAIARMIIALGRSLKLNVIAEGVETPVQKTFLVDSGCSSFQGYMFSRPLPIHELDTYLLRTQS